MQGSVITRRGFLEASVAFAALAERSVLAENAPAAAKRGIRVLFLGTGASGWDPKWAEKNENARRQSSVLLEGKVLVDFTQCSFDKLPKDSRPEVLFQTAYSCCGSDFVHGEVGVFDGTGGIALSTDRYRKLKGEFIALVIAVRAESKYKSTTVDLRVVPAASHDQNEENAYSRKQQTCSFWHYSHVLVTPFFDFRFATK